MNSVYDFLYSDSRRIAAFLSQFTNFGNPSQVKISESVLETAEDTSNNQVSGTLAVLSTRLQSQHKESTVTNQGGETVYDPLWKNAISFVKYLEGEKLIHTDLATSRIGQFVLVEGSLITLDLTMLKQAWETPSIHKGILQGIVQNLSGHPQQQEGNRQQRRAATAQSKGNTKSELDIALALLSMMPHSLQARMVGEGWTVWCTLDELSMVSKPSDLLLKHGALIAGTWRMLGVLDAFPNFSSTADLNNAIVNLAGTMVGEISARISPVAREWLGRPDGAYGMTPLLIYREIARSAGQ